MSICNTGFNGGYNDNPMAPIIPTGDMDWGVLQPLTPPSPAPSNESDCTRQEQIWNKITDLYFNIPYLLPQRTALGPLTSHRRPFGVPRSKKFPDLYNAKQAPQKDEKFLASEEEKKLPPKERRRLRNKVSARNFRVRRQGK